MTDSNKLPKRHHYIPQSYLRNFSQDRERLHIFDKLAGTQVGKFRYAAVNAIAFENKLYTYKTVDLTYETLEDFFSIIEKEAQKVIAKLSNKQELTLQDRSYMAFFICTIWVRTPTFKEEYLGAQEELHEKTIRMMYSGPTDWIKERLKKMGKTMTETEIADLVDFATNEKRSEISMDFPQEYWLKHMLRLAHDCYPLFISFDWEIRHTKEKYAYLTSDNPLMLIPSKPIPFPYGVGLIVEGVKKILPLTADMCLIMHEPKKEPVTVHTEADKKYFRDINNRTVKNAKRYVYSPELGKISKIVKLRPDLIIPWQKRYTVS